LNCKRYCKRSRNSSTWDVSGTSARLLAMESFRLATDGDYTEQMAWPMFVRDEFQQYESLWRVFVVALTERVQEGEQSSIRFLEQTELDKIDRPIWHVLVGQLHYTTLLHLVRVFELRRRRVRDRDSLIEAIARLYAATDTAFELLGRCLIEREPETAKVWNQTPGKDIRNRWMSENDWPLASLRRYRNALLHGGLRMAYDGRFELPDGRFTNAVCFPRFEAISKTPDWREASPDDTAPADQLVGEAWEEVLAYLRQTWNGELVKWACENFEEPAKPPRTMTLEARSFSDGSPMPGPPAAGSAVTSETLAVHPPVAPPRPEG
jgi:hypothetical protein